LIAPDRRETMAERPIFIPGLDSPPLVNVRLVDFTWSPGMAHSQKQKSIQSLHEAAKNQLEVSNILEISSKSESKLGVELSAFNLMLESTDGATASVESFFQGSKVFERGGPFTDLYGKSAREAKKDPRIQSSGALIGFEYGGLPWGLEPKTAFYDWLYVNALMQHINLASAVLDFDAFTDIEFNPKKSINCQAFSAALYCALYGRGLSESALQSPDTFIKTQALQQPVPRPVQSSLPGLT